MDSRLDDKHAASERFLGEDEALSLAETKAAILNALPAHIALLDGRGVILQVNDAWRRFGASNALASPNFAVGENYLEVCERARGDGGEVAGDAADGIRRVLNGSSDTFTIEYDCHSPDEKRWFRLVVTPLRGERVAGVVLMHVNITEQVLATTEKEKLFHTLGERVKELRLLHEVSHILQFEHLPVEPLLRQIVALLPSAWQHPEMTEGCIVFGDQTVATPHFKPTPWELSARFATSDGTEGVVRIVYLEQRTAEGQSEPFLEEEKNLIQSLAEMLASYFERHQAETKLRQLNRLYAVSSAVNAAIVRTQRMQDLYERACQIAVEKGGFLMAWVGLVELDGDLLQPVARWGANIGCCEDEPVSVAEDSPGETLAAQAYRQGGVACRNDLIRDLQSCPRWEEAVRHGCASAAAFALTSEGRSIGAFVVCANQPGFFNEEELRLLNGLAENLSFAGEARVREEQRRRGNERYEKQHAALTALTHGLALPSADLDAALREIAEAVAHTLEVERISVWKFNTGRTSLICHELFERSAGRHSSGLELRGEHYPAYFRAMKENEIISADDAARDERTREFSKDYLRKMGITSMLDAPIQVQGTLDGVLCSEHVGSPRAWTHDEQSFAISIANLISLLLAQTQQKQAEEKITQALREKDVLLKEIHHRVKNNLQVISSLLALQSDSLVDTEAQSLLIESQNRVRAMSMIHEKLYQSSTLSRVQFGEYLTSLAGFLFRSYSQTAGRVELKLDAEEIHLNIDTAVPCGLILNELISNSLKYAFRDGRRGVLRVSLRSVDDHYRLTVQDDGVGLTDNFDLRQADSLGLQLVDALSRQLKANLKVDGRGGASFRLDFKELLYAERK